MLISKLLLAFTACASLGFAASLSISPASVTVSGNRPVFTESGAGPKGVRWSLSPNVGTLSQSPSEATYTEPAGFNQNQTVVLTATDIANPAVVATATISLVSLSGPIAVKVQPSVLDASGPVQQAFTAAVTGAANTAVTWSVSPAIGTISPSGLYTAPTVKVDTNVTIKATYQASTSASGTALIRLHAIRPLTFTTQSNGLQTVIFEGTNFNYDYGENLVTSISSTSPGGQGTRSAPVCSTSVSAASVVKTCANGTAPVVVAVSYSSPDPATITAAIQVTNNSLTDTITNAQISTLGVQMSQYNAALSRIAYLDSNNPIAYVNYGTGQWAIWNDNPSPDVTMSVSCGWNNLCKNQPDILNIAPGQTKTASFSLRFSLDAALPSIELAPEAYAAFAKSYPSVVNWPDRRPVMAWFISDYSKRSAVNPRGYLQQPNLDVSNTANFSAQVLSEAQNIITRMKARPVQPQALLIWDLEGQEFIQATTYVGDPRILSEGYAPEMNAVADQLFAMFVSAGYKVGLTLRPQHLQWGTQLPATCHYDPQNDFKDYYIMVDNPYLQKFYACYDPAGVNWSLIPQGNGGQTFYPSTEPANVTALLMSKVAYAHARWGTTLYYVDTSVWHGGSPLQQDIFRTLQLAFPDCLFIPEESSTATMSVAMPYSDPGPANGPKFAPVSWRYIYPNGGLGIYLANCQGSCWNNNLSSFMIGQRIGDMPIYPQPTQMSTAQLQSIESMILTARSQASSITVTDTSSGASYSYQGAASTVYRYPVKMRVYFAASPAQAGLSTTYCESGQWQGESTCSLNLNGLVTAQIRYYDFAGNLVSAGTPGHL